MQLNKLIARYTIPYGPLPYTLNIALMIRKDIVLAHYKKKITPEHTSIYVNV